MEQRLRQNISAEENVPRSETEHVGKALLPSLHPSQGLEGRQEKKGHSEFNVYIFMCLHSPSLCTPALCTLSTHLVLGIPCPGCNDLNESVKSVNVTKIQICRKFL